MTWWFRRRRHHEQVLERLELLRHQLHHIENRLMATLTDINTNLDKLEADVANAPSQQPPAAATEADLDGVAARVDAIDAAVLAKSQPPAPPAG